MMSESLEIFTVAGQILRAWALTTTVIVDDYKLPDYKLPGNIDVRMKHVTNKKILGDSETLLMFGYIVREKRMQGDLKRILEGTSQSVKRRVDALNFFGLVDRNTLQRTAVQLSITEKGKKYHSILNKNFNKNFEF